MIDYNEIEEKWQKAWSDAKIFEVDPNDKKALMVTAALPYVNSPQHIGHLRTFGTADFYARYMRMKGYNVLYPMAFHATGTPIIAFAKRIRKNDHDLIEEFRAFNISDDDIKKMEDPLYIVSFFSNEIKRGMQRAGFSIDWRRQFNTIDPIFSKLIEWQFYKLKEKGLLTQGNHPVGWCPNENNAVGQHDTRHDVQPEIGTMLVIKFKEPETGIIFGCATYRPETVYGVTNIFVNENAEYVIAKIGDERYYIAKEAAEILKYQLKFEIEKTLSGKELIGKKGINPMTNETVEVLPGFFVKADVGTGVVMSVPTHAPFDYAALERLKEKGYPLPKMEYRKLIEIEPLSNGVRIGRSLSDVNVGEAKVEHPEIPALAYLEILHSNPNAIDDMLEFATKLIYREESHWGVMIVGKYKGMKEPEARELIKKDLMSDKHAFEIYVLTNEEPVYCRCGAKVVVKFVENQWFINYGDPAWKELVKQAFPSIRIFPEALRPAFERVIDWINLRATERAEGLGTRFPFNKDHIIESLSDSTLYMSFYTYAHILKSSPIKPEQLLPEFFEYLYNDVGDIESIAKNTGIDVNVIKKCKESLDYWYVNTSRHSGADLVANHLVMYIFAHVALVNKKFTPKQIVVNGSILSGGEKMSKSLGNIVPVMEGIKKYGADPLRLLEISGASLGTDVEFSADGIESIKAGNEYLYATIGNIEKLQSGELKQIDYWLYSKLNSKIKSATEHLDRFELKEAYTDIFYNSVSELKRYFERGGENKIVVQNFLESVSLMLAPVMPHIAEEFWHMLGKSTFASEERWPIADSTLINPSIEYTEEMISNTIDDARRALALTSKIDANKGKMPSEVKIIIPSDWKTKAYNELVKKKNIQDVLNESPFKDNKEQVAKFLQQFAKNIQSLIAVPEIESKDIIKSFNEAAQYISGKLGVRVVVEEEQNSKSPRASRAFPGKPSIDILYKV
ncbi:MAG: leucine--tRNA ligase [Candidatus Micrarchaeia archaeon]